MNYLDDEYEFMTRRLMPFLRDHWHLIDKPEKLSGEPDGRLSIEEIRDAYDDALRRGRSYASKMLYALLVRYEPLCRSHREGFWSIDELTAGISQADVSVYAQMVRPSFRLRDGVPAPKKWM